MALRPSPHRVAASWRWATRSADGRGAALATRGIPAFVLKDRKIRIGDGPLQMHDVHVKGMGVIISRARTGTPVRMPRFAGEPQAVEDGARARAIVRQRATEWDVDPSVIGLSAGACLVVDPAISDAASGCCRPDLRRTAYAMAVGAPLAGAADDEYQPNDPVLLYRAYRKAGAAAELHLYERGGHCPLLC